MTTAMAKRIGRPLLWGGCVILGALVAMRIVWSGTSRPKVRSSAVQVEDAEVVPPTPQPLFERMAAAESGSADGSSSVASAALNAAPAGAATLTKAEKNVILRRGISEEPRDGAWSPDSERFLGALLAEESFRKGRVREMTCGTTRCGYAVDGISLESVAGNPDSYTQAMRVRLFERFPNVRIFTSHPVDGHFDIQVIAAREGYSLRGIKGTRSAGR